MNGGAVAYLTHSQYGRNRNEVTVNNNSNYITGIAGDTVTAGESTSTTNSYNTTAGMLASTTGNIYGVYDMSGGAREYTANWDPLSNSSYITNCGKAVDETAYFTTEGTSDKYKTAYSNGTEEYSGEIVKTVCRTGDGIKETWVVSSECSWFNDSSHFVASSYPFSHRGGYYNHYSTAGVFYSNDEGGYALGYGSFRIVLAR